MAHSGEGSSQKLAVEVVKGKNGVEQVLLRNNRGASARVSLHGGQVLSWKTDKGEELLFTSTKAVFKPPKAVRGGIPICFSQFGARENLDQHGFARNKIWKIDDNPPPLKRGEIKDKSCIDLLLKPSEDDLKIWPHSFEFRLKVSLAADGNLTLISRIRNVNCKPFSFSIAFHTYFSISDISEVRVEGLEVLDYLDNLHDKQRFTEQGDALTFESEVKAINSKLGRLKIRINSELTPVVSLSSKVIFQRLVSSLTSFSSQIDRVYLSSSYLIAVLDHERKRTFVIRKAGLPDVVVWNPWEKKAKAIIDLGDEDYKQMLCVDGAAIEKPITLKPGEEWTGRLELSVLPSS